jgi:5-methylcytosine-specific restriction protein B
MQDRNHKKRLLELLEFSKKISQDIFELKDGTVIQIKVSKVHTSGNYWYTLNQLNITNFDTFKVVDFIFTGSEGYYRIPIKVLKKFLKNYKEVPKDDKYHFAIFPVKNTLERNSDNVVDVKAYYHPLPEPFSMLKSTLQKSHSFFDDRNFFTFQTGENSIDLLCPDKISEFKAFTVQHHKEETNIGDIVFFSQYGDSARVAWDQGLSTICEITQIRQNGTSIDVTMKPLLLLSKVLHRSAFKGFFKLYDIKGVGPMTKGQKSQPNTKITLDVAQELVAAIEFNLPEDKSKIDEVFGANFGKLPPNIGDISFSGDINNNYILKGVDENPINGLPFNLIIYGAPGTGKSHELKNRVNTHFPNELLRTRITFHPNYNYRNFVGTYKPSPLYKNSEFEIYSSKKTNEEELRREPVIDYIFEPGPFIQSFLKAYHNPNHNFVLIIEELNRANAPAVFGELFQLLDREADGKSTYSVRLEEASMKFLRYNYVDDEEIRMPQNLYIWATMNNADQGVLPLDAAFKRRWSFEHIGLNENEEDAKGYIHFKFIPPGKQLNWNDFRKQLNTYLIENLKIHEDKLIAPFFLRENELTDENAIKNKLFLYLKEDVLRYKDGLFKAHTFSQVCESYNKGEMVFNEDFGIENHFIPKDDVTE